jgi:hypothetical protein
VGCGIGIWNVVTEREAARHLQFAPTTEQFISFASDHAVMDARQYDHVALDYSIASLKQVDKILGRVHDSYVANPESVSLPGMSAEYGAYVGEVICRNEPNAYWARDSQVIGEKSYPLHWNAGESYPFSWCSKRITNGAEDSIWVKYSALKDRASTARVATSNAHASRRWRQIPDCISYPVESC